MKPKIIISLDFEIKWGFYNLKKYSKSYDKNLYESKNICLLMLEEFKKRKLRATWATVGALGLKNWDEFFSLYKEGPKYENRKLIINNKFAKDNDKELFFAPEIINEIIKNQGQDLGSHSFSHLYCHEKGLTSIDFINELKIVEGIWKEKFNTLPVSFVFPQNQINFTQHLNKSSIKIWRSNQRIWYDQKLSKSLKPIARLASLLNDTNIFSMRDFSSEINNSKASIFIRFNLPEYFWKMHLSLIKKFLKRLKNNDEIHLWWHPHNLGFNKNVAHNRLIEFLDILTHSLEKYNLVSYNMRDLTIKNYNKLQ